VNRGNLIGRGDARVDSLDLIGSLKAVRGLCPGFTSVFKLTAEMFTVCSVSMSEAIVCPDARVYGVQVNQSC